MNRMMKTCERSLLNQSIHGFHIVKKLGEGSYASVWLGQHPITNCLVAIKSISKERINDAIKITRFQRELSLMKSLDHPLIASLFFYDQDDHYHYLGIEYASKGDLQNYVNSHGKIIEPIARKYFVQLISVLEYLHKEKRIINRDLKAENILLDDNLNIRVVDFGLSNSFQGDNPKFSTMCGSPGMFF
ncbi:hypothetical protein TRFO_06501 [Tritrichomonas foetus]|uniref:Protein kinase domain-containing protein n=1 Tax=Tritrichomonas foetus TaxID=1144522 RepID=A0A1J4K365_9EUKA|nr:hypothetical protein TRFO_06501 [Tritrichomonas foetus]|eukprot:OHT04166.1 hypothetical protein TRFO_06501 [Tritrichomonas foetus]